MWNPHRTSTTKTHRLCKGHFGSITNLWFLMGFCKMEFGKHTLCKTRWTMAWFSPQRSSWEIGPHVPPTWWLIFSPQISTSPPKPKDFQQRLLCVWRGFCKTITLFLFCLMILEVYKEYVKLREADGHVKLSDNLMHQSLYIAWSCIECGVLAVGIPLYSNTLDPIQSYCSPWFQPFLSIKLDHLLR